MQNIVIYNINLASKLNLYRKIHLNVTKSLLRSQLSEERFLDQPPL